MAWLILIVLLCYTILFSFVKRIHNSLYRRNEESIPLEQVEAKLMQRAKLSA